MGIGASIFLIAAGAILSFAVNVRTRGLDLHTVGLILLAVGVLGVVVSAAFWSSWAGMGTRRRTEIVEDQAPYADGGRRVVHGRTQRL